MVVCGGGAGGYRNRLVDIGIGWWILGRSGAKKVTPVVVNSPVEKTTFDVSGKSVQAVEITGVVQKWHPDTGEIEFLRNGKLETLKIDPAETVIFVPSRKVKNKEIKILAKGGIQWETAFCTGDLVTFRLAGDKVVLADNGGGRSCGFKGE